MGVDAGYSITTGHNVMIGYGAGDDITSGGWNVIIGGGGTRNYGVDFGNNIAIGYDALSAGNANFLQSYMLLVEELQIKIQQMTK